MGVEGSGSHLPIHGWLILMVKVGIETSNNKQSELPTKGQDFIPTGIVRSPIFLGNQTSSTCKNVYANFKGFAQVIVYCLDVISIY